MTSTQWNRLLRAWSSQLLTTDLVQRLDPSERDLKYLGFPPASESHIASLESRLGVKLPPSYRAFFKATNGFRVISRFIDRLRCTDDVDWFRVENQGWIETFNEPTIYDDPDRPQPSDDEYFDYADPHGNPDFRSQHLFSLLQVSDVYDGAVMLLNPLAVTPDGEWEAWFFANWAPGATRYASFAHMMLDAYRTLRKTEHLPARPKLPTIAVPGAKVPRHSVVDAPEPYEPTRPRRRRKKGQSQIDFIAQFMSDAAGGQVAPAPPQLVQLLKDLNKPDPRARAKTIRILQGKLKIRAMSMRHPDLVPLASELARSLPDPESRCACVSLLTSVAPDGPSPHWLISALNDPHPWVQQAGLSAVFYFKGPELLAPIAKILSGPAEFQLAQSAATALAEIPDSRAVPELAAQLTRDPHSETPLPAQALEQHYVNIALALARYGRLAVPHLVPLLSHPDRNRRVAAIVALRTLGDPGSRRAAAKLKSDLDPGVRQQAEICDRIWGDMTGFEVHDL